MNDKTEHQIRSLVIQEIEGYERSLREYGKQHRAGFGPSVKVNFITRHYHIISLQKRLKDAKARLALHDTTSNINTSP
jgi:hypothetical protein